jgi:Zn-dependent protease
MLGSWLDFFFALTTWVALVFIFSFHNYLKALTAVKLGDDTPRRYGFLTIDPLVHIDPIGTVLIPFVLILFGSKLVIGWPRQVPLNYELFERDKKKLIILLSVSILSYFAIALVGLLLFHLVQILNLPRSIYLPLAGTFEGVYFIAAFFGFLNLIPIPPLDAGIILFLLLKKSYYEIHNISFWGMIIVLLLFLSGLLDHLFRPIFNFLGTFL